jgi:hypothetical protein
MNGIIARSCPGAIYVNEPDPDSVIAIRPAPTPEELAQQKRWEPFFKAAAWHEIQEIEREIAERRRRRRED